MSKIIKLQAENIKRLKAIQIDPEGGMVVIGGKNGQGKTSTLDAIWYALGGKGAMPNEPLRKGAEKGFSEVTLDNGLIITRRVTQTGTTLKVENAEGLVHKSPQTLLDNMVGAISFDPMAFSRMEPKQQLEQLRILLGIDTSQLEAQREMTYNKRTTFNRAVKELKAQLDSVPFTPSMPDEEISVSGLMEQLAAIEKDQDDFCGKMEDAEKLDDELTDLGEQITDTELRLKSLRAEAKQKKAKLARMRKAIGDAPTVVGSALQTAIDEVRDQISKADGINSKVRNNEKHATLKDRVQNGERQAADLTHQIEEIDEQKRTMIESAEFPVAGLSFDEDGVRFNDIPFEQCSSAEQTRVSVGMALAMNPELRVLLIRDGSLLDDDSFAMIAEMAAEADAQVWVEAVSTDEKKCAVIIEDGAVK